MRLRKTKSENSRSDGDCENSFRDRFEINMRNVLHPIYILRLTPELELK